MTIDDNIRDEKIKCGINREAAKISPLSSGKIDKQEYLAGEEIYCQIKEWYIFSFRKALEKQEKAIEEEGKKQVQALEFLKPNTQKLTIEDVVPENTVKKLKMNLIKSKKYKNR